MIKLIKKYIIFILIISGCANVVPPSGGPPDKTPPVILSTEPLPGTLNFREKTVTLAFSKYMDKNSIFENTAISPTRKLEFDWSGKEVDIKITEPLDTNTTYAVSLGTDIADIKGNKPVEAFTLIFSTGSKLDSGRIPGMLYDEKPSGVFIFAYKLTGINPDTLNPFHTKPQYKTQIGSNGKFVFQALKEGKYRLFAIRDEYKDEIYDEGTDAFGAAQSDVVVTSDTMTPLRLKIGGIIDKTGPAIFDIEALANRKFVANFSKLLDTASVRKESFELTDSVGKRRIDVTAAYLSQKAGSKVEFITATPLDTFTKWKLMVSRDSLKAIKDTSGNIIQDTARTSYFYSSNDLDSTKPALLKTPMNDSAKNIDATTLFEFSFNSAIDRNNFDKRIKFIAAAKQEPVKYHFRWKMDNLLDIIPDNKLGNDTWYEIDLSLDSLKNVLGYKIAKDTTLKIRFKTNDTRTYGGARGKFTDSLNLCKNPILMMISKDTKQRFRSVPADSGKWEFLEIPAGTYTFEAFCDENQDGKYSYGKPFPFEFSEPFVVFNREVTIKPRWKVENIILSFPR